MTFSDAMTKCKLIAAGMSAAKASGEDRLFVRFALGWFSSQFNKYFYERFIISAPPTNSLLKNIAIVLVILMYSLDIHLRYSIDESKLVAASTFMIFVGAVMDSKLKAPSSNIVQEKAKPGRKLRKHNEKA